MKAESIWMCCGTNRYVAQMADGSLRWVRPDFQGVDSTGPMVAWFERGKTAHSVSWNGPAIQRAAMFEATLNKALA